MTALRLRNLVYASALALVAVPSSALSADACTIGVNCVPNATLVESTDPAIGVPEEWKTNVFGASDAQFSLAPGRTDNAAVTVVATAHEVGADAKWAFTEVPVKGGQYFEFGNWYKATADTAVYAYFRGGTQPYMRLATLPPTEAPDTWTELKLPGFFVPPGATAMTVSHVLLGNGSLTTDDYSLMQERAPVFPQGLVSLTFDDGWKSIYDNAIPILDRAGLRSTQFVTTLPVVLNPDRYTTNMTISDVRYMESHGHEIGAHTQSHRDLVQEVKDDGERQAEIGGSRSDLLGAGITTVDTFAYPYGRHDARVRQIAAEHFIAARTTEPGFNTTTEDRFALKGQSVIITTTPADVRAWTDYAMANKLWLTLVLHRVEPELADCVKYGTEDPDRDCTDTATLRAIVDHLKELPQGTVRTVREVVSDEDLWATAED